MDGKTAGRPGPPPPPLPERSVTARAVGLGLALIPPNVYWILTMEQEYGTAHPTTFSMFFNCIFLLVALTGVNGLVARAAPRHALRQGELLLVYAMLCLSSSVAAVDMAQVLIPTLVWPYGEATPANGYTALFSRYLPAWAMVSDIQAAHGFFQGHDTLYTGPHLRAWLPPALIWTGFTTVLLFTLQCVNVLIRKQWMENEKLTFPLVQLPLQITDA